MTTPMWLMIPMALTLGLGFVGAFLYCMRSGQFDDLDTPAHRILQEEKKRKGQQ